MKFFWIFSCLFALNGAALKAQDTLSLYQAYPSFSDREKAEWTSFQNKWKYVYYPALKQGHHIKRLDCSTCKSFYAELYIEINAMGDVSKAICVHAMHCGLAAPDLRAYQDFEESVRGQHFSSLRNESFILRLGEVLGC